MDDSNDVARATAEFMTEARAAIEHLASTFESTDLYRDRIAGKIPNHGVLEDGTVFWFHGIGLRYVRAGGTGGVDFDFSSNNEVGRIDVFRLYRYLNERPERWDKFRKRLVFFRAMLSAVSAGILKEETFEGLQAVRLYIEREDY